MNPGTRMWDLRKESFNRDLVTFTSRSPVMKVLWRADFGPEFRTVIRTMQPANLAKLSHTLSNDARVMEYRIAPTSE